jgi:Zn-finger nucleic acid-binding protein
MDRSSFEAADPIVERMAEAIDHVLKSPQFEEIRQSLIELSETVGHRYSVNLNVSIDVFDPNRGHPLPILMTGLSTSTGEPPYRTWGDSSPQKYIVEGEMQVVPHDRCPRCHGIWDFKFEHHTCSGCGATLGKDVKVLLDTDACPHCEEGKVSMSSLVCRKCGFQVEPALVVWG